MKDNVLLRLRAKERQAKGTARVNHRVIRSIICQDDVEYQKIWETQTASSSVYDSKRLYFDNYRVCMAGCGFKGKPSLLYKLPKCPTKQKIEDALICQFHPEGVSEETRPHLITLTKDNWIVRYQLDTGQVLQRVYLHPKLNYHYLNWNEVGNSFVVKTTQTRTTSVIREANAQGTVFVTMAVFTVYPLALKACFEVNTKVFGDYITGAHLQGENMLFTMETCNIVKFYSFDRILQENQLDRVDLGDNFPRGGAEGCRIGAEPYGIPITLRITEKPQVLFQISCHDHDVQFGGIPWHFMKSPNGNRDPSTIEVCRLADKKMAINGQLEKNIVAMGTPGAVFHFDESNRIINTRLRTMDVYKIHQRDDGQTELVLDHVIKPWINDEWEDLERSARDLEPILTGYSLAGRPLRQMPELWDGDGVYNVMSSQMICNFNCDDEMDIMAVTMPTHCMETDELYGYVTLHDNGTGRLLKMIRIPGEWDDTLEHQMSIDLDTLIHTFKNRSGKWCCHVYRAQRKNFTQEKRKVTKVKGHRRSRRR